MNTGFCKGVDARSWRDLYHSAVCESDINKLRDRITDAETALTMRVRELFYTSGDNFEEEESLDDAMCILHALRNSLKHRAAAIQRTSDFDYPRGACSPRSCGHPQTNARSSGEKAPDAAETSPSSFPSVA